MDKLNSLKCRHCNTELEFTLVDLGTSPLCNTLISEDKLNNEEVFYPLHTRVCKSCFLVQVGDFVAPDEIFSEYSYFSSFSDMFVEHARIFAEASIKKLNLNEGSLIYEVASNDGYLLQHYLPHKIPVIGIEPAENVAKVASDKGIKSVCKFLGSNTAVEIVNDFGQGDLVIANNVIAHTPYLNDFVKGLASITKPTGVISVEFPHLLVMLEDSLYDMIYHEHFSYYSLYSIECVLKNQGLKVFDVEKITTHGGSLRISAAHEDNPVKDSERLVSLRQEEADFGITNIERYSDFSAKVEKTKRDLLNCLIKLRNNDKHIVGYGVPGKGNTLLNYCGIRNDFIDYMVDRNPYKQGKYTPGTRIPIYAAEKISETKPDYILIMPWNLVSEITKQLEYTREWGCQFIIPLPEVKVIK